jgi:hypothetical protein
VSVVDEPQGPAQTDDRAGLRTALKHCVSALKSDGVPFALAGGYALWVRGAPEPVHDVDVVVPEPDVDRAATCLAGAGFRIERPPEDWLFKAWLDSSLVDVLHRLQDVPVDEQLIDTAEEFEVLGVRVPVLPATQIVTTKLQSLSEHYCDFAALLPVVRAVREQLDWTTLRRATRDQLADRLGITEPDRGRGAQAVARPSEK